MSKTAAGKHGEKQDSSRDAGSRTRCKIDDGLRTAESELLVISPRVGGLEPPKSLNQETASGVQFCYGPALQQAVEIFPLPIQHAARVRRSSGLALLFVASHALPPSVSSIVHWPQKGFGVGVGKEGWLGR